MFTSPGTSACMPAPCPHGFCADTDMKLAFSAEVIIHQNLNGKVQCPFPLVEVDVEEDGPENQPGLKQKVLGILVMAGHHCHLCSPGFLQRQLLDVLDVVHLVKEHVTVSLHLGTLSAS